MATKRYAGATYTDAELRTAITRAQEHRRRRGINGWGVFSSYPSEGLIAIWPTEQEAQAQRDEVNAISDEYRFSVRYDVRETDVCWCGHASERHDENFECRDRRCPCLFYEKPSAEREGDNA